MKTEVISSFICYGKYMVTVRVGNAVHVMPCDEWKKVYGKLHPERWQNGKRVTKSRKIS